MKVLKHHVYEYRKGIRRLILHTTAKSNRAVIEHTLKRREIAFLIYPLGENKINVFFGDGACVEVIRKFNKHNLYDLTGEEDFILGTMLGYDTVLQCRRYLDRKAAGLRAVFPAAGAGFAQVSLCSDSYHAAN